VLSVALNEPISAGPSTSRTIAINPVSRRETAQMTRRCREIVTSSFRDGDLLPNGSRLSCGALKKDSFLNLRAPAASSAC